MKKLYTFITILITATVVAQVPAGYYNTATGSGYALKTQLRKIIDNDSDGISGEHLSQDNGYAGLYDTFILSDKDFYYENNGTLLDMYSEKPAGTDAYEFTYGVNQDDGSGGTAEGQKYNREHIIPQSVFNGDSPMKNDAHFVVPTDKYVNGVRGNLPFGRVLNANFTSTNGTKRGNNNNSGYSAGYSNDVFEPIDEFKGDIARMYFYFATRYETSLSGWSYDMFDGSTNKAFDQTFLNILYQWHVQDPVSQRELDRNNAIHDQQNNRNPFIDNPAYVFNVWQSALAISEFEQQNAINIYPNPIDGNTLYIATNKAVSVEIYNVLGKKIITTKVDTINNKVDVGFLYSGVYLIKLSSNNGSITKKIIKK
ncbi:MAG: endonuclease [Aquaticitalea sp.]